MGWASVPRWLDGRLLAEHELLPPSDVPGVFETLRCERGALGFLQAHLERLEQGARALELPWPPPLEARTALAVVARAVGPGPFALRLTWTPPHLALVARALPPTPDEVVVLVAPPGRVAPPRPFGAKTTLRTAYDALRRDVLHQGIFEVLVRAPDGALIEGTRSNLFVVLTGELCTPPLASGALPGIVRAALLAELERSPLRTYGGRSWPVSERSLSAGDLARAEEVLLTNSLLRVAGVARLTGEDIVRADLPGARGPLAQALFERVERLEAASYRPGILRSDPC